MTRNTVRIINGLRLLATAPHEIMSGTVVPGSLNTTAGTVSVQQSEGSIVIEGVMLNAQANDNSGIVLFPDDNSNVIIGSIDGSGEWTVLQTGKLSKCVIKIGAVVLEIDESGIKLQNSEVLLNISNSHFKMNTPSESLFGLLKDLITALTLLTVTTSTGPSSVPINVSTFNNLLLRLNNLLEA
jgi:hypothetical protein